MSAAAELRLDRSETQRPSSVRMRAIGETGKYINGVAFKPTDWGDEGCPIVRIQNLTDPKKPMNRTTRSVDPIYVVRPGDLLVSWSATLDAFIWDREPALLNQHIFKVVPNTEVVSKKYLFFALRQAIIEMGRTEHLHGSTMKHINRGPFLAHQVRVPTLREQAEIVAEIEKQFSRLDEAVANLQRVKARRIAYKQTVLEAAITGRLFGIDAGADDNDRAAGERLRAWVYQTRRSNWPGGIKYKEPAQPEKELNLTVPNSWAKVSWEAVLAPVEGAFKRGPFGSALTKAMFVTSGYKVYEQYCPINDDCSFARYYITPQKFDEMRGFAVAAGDFLVSCSGVTLGRITRVPEQYEPGIINQALLRVRINPEVMSPQFFLMLFRSPRFQSFVFDRSAGAAIPNVRGVGDLKAIPVPVPPLAEQHRIVAEVDRRLSIVREVEAEVDANLNRAQALRQAVLAKAFGG
jgi:type I restriction enzyme, S subunit